MASENTQIVLSKSINSTISSSIVKIHACIMNKAKIKRILGGENFACDVLNFWDAFEQLLNVLFIDKD